MAVRRLDKLGRGGDACISDMDVLSMRTHRSSTTATGPHIRWEYLRERGGKVGWVGLYKLVEDVM